MKNFSNDNNVNGEEEELKEETISEENAGVQNNDLEEKLLLAEKEAAENLAGWQRAKADFLNYKKDQENMLSELRKYANEEVIRELLPTVDSFDLAAKHLPPELQDSEWVKGVMCIKGMFESFLRDMGVSEIKVVGAKFDPYLFEAVASVESDEEEDKVVEQVQKGYKMGAKVIRPAKVKVTKKKERE